MEETISLKEIFDTLKKTASSYPCYFNLSGSN